MKVLDFIKSGGPNLTVGSTTFEMWLVVGVHERRQLYLPIMLPRRECSGRGGNWVAASSQSVGAWSVAIDNRLDTWLAPQELKDCHIAEMDRTASSIGRSLQG